MKYRTETMDVCTYLIKHHHDIKKSITEESSDYFQKQKNKTEKGREKGEKSCM